jgi:hypothetical protein
LGLKDRLRRLQKASGERPTELVCEVCGERLTVPRDITLRLTYAAWHKRRAERRGEPVVQDDPIIKLMESHPHDALVNVRTGRPGGRPGRPHAR